MASYSPIKTVLEPREGRRPRLRELDRLEVKQIRPLVQRGQQSFELDIENKQQPVVLALNWLERWGGTFGPKSSAEANCNRNVPSGERFLRRLDQQNGEAEVDPDRTIDRGQVPAWLLYFNCPKCGRRCMVLYSLKGQNDYACPRCTKPCYPDREGGPSGTGKSRWEKRERARIKHQLKAERIRRDYLKHTEPNTMVLVPHASTIPKPKRMSWRRYEALCRLVEAHETLALLSQLPGLRHLFDRVEGRTSNLSDEHGEKNFESWANRILKVDAWALRQRSWSRPERSNNNQTAKST